MGRYIVLRGGEGAARWQDTSNSTIEMHLHNIVIPLFGSRFRFGGACSKVRRFHTFVLKCVCASCFGSDFMLFPLSPCLLLFLLATSCKKIESSTSISCTVHSGGYKKSNSRPAAENPNVTTAAQHEEPVSTVHSFLGAWL